ncbi:MAG TPA: PilZ domain-containing protein [Terracidiphilus sp.]|nr:PilZ domain-containing protein [Terracidiphilus sp.]
MAVQKFCVYNQTRESFLSLGVTVANVLPAILKDMLGQLDFQADGGLWLTPFHGMPSVVGITPVDLVYLDTEFRVLKEVESFPTMAAEPPKEGAATALVLPAHTIYSSQTQPTDQLVICVAEEMERKLEKLSGALNATTGIAPTEAAARSDPGIGKSDVSHLQSPPIHVQSTFQGSDEMKNFEPRTGRPNSLKTWLQNWLSSDRRRSLRQPLPGLVAYYWTGSTPRAYQISDISSSGFYVLTEERWFPGTLVLMTLQRTDSLGRNLDDCISVQTKVVRWGSDGLGLAFVLARTASSDNPNSARENGADRKTLERFLERLNEPADDRMLVPR